MAVALGMSMRHRECLVRYVVENKNGSACDPVIVPVFKTGGRRVTPSPVGSTPTRFRQNTLVCLENPAEYPITRDAFAVGLFGFCGRLPA